MNNIKKLLLLFCFIYSSLLVAQPNWPAIKSNATFIIADTTYNAATIQPVNVGGWEDGLFMTRDGKHLFSTYLPLDAFSWITDLVLSPICFNFHPYLRGPLLGIDTLTNTFGCPNYMHSDIIIASRADTSMPFTSWNSSNLQTPFSFDGGAQGVLRNADTFDLFVYTKDGIGTQNEDIMFMKNVPVNPSAAAAVPIVSTTGQEDNPHIERLNDSSLVLFFDRDRYMYYALSNDDGATWQTPVLITNVLNDQAPYDVQPHLWNDGSNWWVYFCANNTFGVRCIYKSKQLIPNNWDSWGPKELVIEPGSITGGYGTIYGIGEPTLTQWGDLSFVVVYGNTSFSDTTDVFDCDPWIITKKGSPLTGLISQTAKEKTIQLFPNPANDIITISIPEDALHEQIQIINELGVVMKEIQMNTTQLKLNIADLPKGIYFLKSHVTNSNLKFIKQ